MSLEGIYFNNFKIENENKFGDYIFDYFNYYESKFYIYIKKIIKQNFIENNFNDKFQKSRMIKVKDHVK
jgi:hypothetical protein